MNLVAHTGIEFERYIVAALSSELGCDFLGTFSVSADGIFLACGDKERQGLGNLLIPILSGDSFKQSEEVSVTRRAEEEAAVGIGNVFIDYGIIIGQPVKYRTR